LAGMKRPGVVAAGQGEREGEEALAPCWPTSVRPRKLRSASTVSWGAAWADGPTTLASADTLIKPWPSASGAEKSARRLSLRQWDARRGDSPRGPWVPYIAIPSGCRAPCMPFHCPPGGSMWPQCWNGSWQWRP
jgi:hypothetical protein